MKVRGVIVTLGILGFCSLGCFAVNCYSNSSVQHEQQRCFEKYSLVLSVGSDDSIHKAVQNDPEAVCGAQDSHKQAMQCALNMTRNCMVTRGENPDILSDVWKVEEGISYLCEHVDDINSQCVKNQAEDMKQCARRKATRKFRANPTQDTTAITCKAFEIAEECGQEELSVCGSETKNVMVNLTKNYLTPPACGRQGPHYAYRKVAPMMTEELPDASCYTQSIIQEGRTCFEGLTLDLNLEGGSHAAKQSLLDAFLDAALSKSRDFGAVCRQLSQYKNSLVCVLGVIYNCMSDGYKNYLPSPSDIEGMVTELCKHVDDLNQQCVRSRVSALVKCGYNAIREQRISDIGDWLCSRYKFKTKCHKEELPDCGCKTTRLYVSIAKEYLNPAACSPNYDTIPQCRDDSDQFITTTDGATRKTTSDDHEERDRAGKTTSHGLEDRDKARTDGAIQYTASAGFLATFAFLASLVFM